MKKLYPEVTCDETDGWKSGPEKLDTKANAILYVKCAAKGILRISMRMIFDLCSLSPIADHWIQGRDGLQAI